MFYQIRYQTGEINEIISEMKKGNIPCMDVTDIDELDWFLGQLANLGVFKVEGIQYDRDARNRIQEPEFEYRIAFSSRPGTSETIDAKDLMYIDFYFEPEYEETYDSIFGD